MRSKMHRNLFCTAVDENMRIVSHDATIFLCEDYALNTLEEKRRRFFTTRMPSNIERKPNNFLHHMSNDHMSMMD